MTSTQLQRIATSHLPYIELYEPDDLGAVNTRTWQNWTTQPSPDGQPITSYGYSTIVALRPGEAASARYPGVPWALAVLGALAVLAARLVLARAAARAARADRDRGLPGMRRLIAEKIGLALVMLAFVLTFNFFLFRALGDPRNDLLRVPHMPAAERAHLIHERGLDRSLLDQYGIYVRNTLSGQLETSYHAGRPVTDVIGDALPNTLILALPATLLAALLGTLDRHRLGAAARQRGRRRAHRARR